MADRAVPLLLVRTDANARIGTGHLLRCLALAHAWREAGGDARFLTAETPGALLGRITGQRFVAEEANARPTSVEDAALTLRRAVGLGAAWIVLDGYQFGLDYQRVLHGHGPKLLVVDDHAQLAGHRADAVLDQNLDADATAYAPAGPGVQLLLGPRHALLRPEFDGWRHWERAIPDEATRLLVTFGGVDAINATSKALEALRLLRGAPLQASIVVGAANPNSEELERVARALPGTALVRDPPDMAQLMASHDLAISAAGVTAWELAATGLPALTIAVAENQRRVAAALAGAGAVVDLGWHGEATPQAIARAVESLVPDAARRRRMSTAGRSLVDGHGAARSAAALLGVPLVRARPVRPDDRERLFAWANDSQTRQMSFRPEPIAWEDHVGWFERVGRDSQQQLLMADLEAPPGWTPVARVQFDADGVVSITVAPEHRGRGLSEHALRQAVAARRRVVAGQSLVAYVKPENEASLRAFAKAGFESVGAAVVQGQACVKYVYRPAAATPALTRTEKLVP